MLKEIKKQIGITMAGQFDSLLSQAMESFADGSEVFLLQIGAGDGRSGDFLYPYLIKKGWRALLIEPHGPAFDRLCTTYADFPTIKCCQMAISDHNGVQDFYSVADTDGLPWWADQIPSLISDVILSHESLIPDLRERIVVTSMPCQKIETLVKAHAIERIDIVAVDTEGMDALIVNDILRAGINPQLMLFEHKHLGAEVRSSLSEKLLKSYTVVEGPYDMLCIHRSSFAELSMPRN